MQTNNESQRTDASRDLGFYWNALNVVAAAYVYWQDPTMFTPEVAAFWLTGKGIGNIALDFLKKNGIKVS